MTNEELEADLKAEWKNLEVLVEKNKALTSALQGLVRAVDGVDWDCTENQAMGRLDDARSIARAAIASQTNPGGQHGK